MTRVALPRASALSRSSHGLILQAAAISTTPPTPTSTAAPTDSPCHHRRPFSVFNRPPPNYPGHVPLTRVERVSLALGSGVMSFLDPYRGDLIAAFAEATSTPYFIPRLRDAMLRSPTGRRILRDRPRLTSSSLNLPRLRSLPPNTVGATYVSWLDREGVSPDTRPAVRYIDDEECAYVMQRYRECHDFYHALTGLPIVREGEVALKAFEWANTGLPMTGLSMFSALTLNRSGKKRFVQTYLPWALRNGWRCEEVINVYWEEELENDVKALRARLGVEQPPDLRDIRRKEREEKRMRRQLEEQQAGGRTAQAAAQKAEAEGTPTTTTTTTTP